MRENTRRDLPKKVEQMYSEIWLPDLLDSEKWLSSLFSILLNCKQKRHANEQRFIYDVHTHSATDQTLFLQVLSAATSTSLNLNLVHSDKFQTANGDKRNAQRMRIALLSWRRRAEKGVWCGARLESHLKSASRPDTGWDDIPTHKGRH